MYPAHVLFRCLTQNDSVPLLIFPHTTYPFHLRCTHAVSVYFIYHVVSVHLIAVTSSQVHSPRHKPGRRRERHNYGKRRTSDGV